MSADMGARRITTRSSLLIASAVSESRERWRARFAEAFDVFEVVEPRTHEKFMESLRPEVLVVDLALPKLGRVNSLPHLRRLSRSTKILALTDVPDESEGMMVLKTGAKGYHPRVIDPALLRKAVEAILRGEIWIQRKLVANLVAEIVSLSEGRQAETEDGFNPCLEGLTLRQ